MAFGENTRFLRLGRITQRTVLAVEDRRAQGLDLLGDAVAGVRGQGLGDQPRSAGGDLGVQRPDTEAAIAHVMDILLISVVTNYSNYPTSGIQNSYLVIFQEMNIFGIQYSLHIQFLNIFGKIIRFVPTLFLMRNKDQGVGFYRRMLSLRQRCCHWCVGAAIGFFIFFSQRIVFK